MMRNGIPPQAGWRERKTRGAAPPVPPFVSTKQFMRLARITKSQRTNMQKVGVCKPARIIQDGKHYYYSLDQLQEVDLASVMLANGMLYDEVGSVFKGEPAAVDEIAYRCAEENQRVSRRTVKRMAFLRKRASSVRAVAGMEGWYLRYLPNRWLALVPASSSEAIFETPDRLAGGFKDLIDVADVVGWARTTMFGALASLDAEGDRHRSWQFVELSSPPMPAVTGSMVVDGGCYQSACGVGGDPRCDLEYCFECSRFGREPSDEERARWKEAEKANPRLWDGCLMAQDMDAPYRFGIWSDFSASYAAGDRQHEAGDRQHTAADRHRGGDRQHEAGGQHRGGGKRGYEPTLRPRLMPQVHRLPMGVAACALPAGVYLCRQEEYGKDDRAHASLIETLRGLDGFEFSDSMEEEAIRRFQDKLSGNRPDPRLDPRPAPPPQHTRRGGPYLEPFAVPRDGGDPRFISWHRCLSDGELGKLRIPYGMALWPQDGFIVLAEALPDAYATGRVVKEYQVYVDPGSLGPDGYQVFGGDGGFIGH